MHARGLHAVIRELQLTLGKVQDAELVLLLRCISHASKNLLQDTSQLASEIIGRMRQVKGMKIILSLILEDNGCWVSPVVVHWTTNR